MGYKLNKVEGAVDLELNRKESQSYLNILLDELTDSFGDEQTLQDDSNPSKATMRSIAKELAGRDRQRKAELIARRRKVGLAQSTIDEAFGFEPGTTREIETYDSDPRLSELRRYEYFIMLTELQENASTLRDQSPTNQES